MSVPDTREIGDLTVSEIPLGDLRPHPRNPRKIRPERLAQLKRTLEADREMLRARPLIALPDGTVIAGNQRLRAATELGWETIPVAYADLDDERATLWALRDNRGYGEDDLEITGALLAELADAGADLDLSGYASAEIDALLAATRVPSPVDPDDAPPLPVGGPESRLGEVYELGPHRLMCGDATDAEQVATLMDSEALDCVFTSPPYAVGVDYGASYEDTLVGLRRLIFALANVWREHVRDGGFCVVNFGDIVAASEIVGSDEPCEYPTAIEYWPVFRSAGWTLFTRRIWAKPHARVHSPWAIGSARAASDWEHLWTWKRPGPAVKRRSKVSAFGVWDTSSEHGVDLGKATHGAGMAVALAERALLTHAHHGAVVADPFAGTGTTVIAAEITGRRCFAMEIDPAYCDVIRHRYARYTGGE